MTHALRKDSPRRVYAQRFGQLLRATLTARGVGEKRLVAVIGGSRSTLRQYLAGYNLPRLGTAAKLAQALQEPRLLSICRQGRTRDCNTCGKPYVDENGSPSRYCSERCTNAAKKLRIRPSNERDFELVVAERTAEVFEAQLHGYHGAVANMCRSCEPEGVCRTPDCPLRSVSPLPLAVGRVPIVTPAAGPYGSPENRAKTIAALRERLRLRWADPEQRRIQSERTAQMHRDGKIPPRGKTRP